MDRLIIFGDSRTAFSARLAGEVIEAAGKRNDLRVVGICDAGSRRPLPWFVRQLRARLGVAVVGAFNPDLRAGLKGYSAVNLYDIARKYDTRVIVPPGREFNQSAFVERLKREHRPTLAPSLGCRQIFGRELLKAFELAVNLHDALLPEYRGLNATRWSCYKGESEAGITYHVMNEGIDAGPILLQRSVKAADFAGAREIVEEKLRLARSSAGELLEMMVARIPGRPQVGRGSYFGRKEIREITAVGDLSGLTWEEARKRLHAFGFLKVTIRGKSRTVTALERSENCRAGWSRPAFRTGDGIPVRATRFHYLPRPLSRVLKILRAV